MRWCVGLKTRARQKSHYRPEVNAHARGMLRKLEISTSLSCIPYDAHQYTGVSVSPFPTSGGEVNILLLKRKLTMKLSKGNHMLQIRYVDIIVEKLFLLSVFLLEAFSFIYFQLKQFQYLIPSWWLSGKKYFSLNSRM